MDKEYPVNPTRTPPTARDAQWDRERTARDSAAFSTEAAINKGCDTINGRSVGGRAFGGP